MSVIKAEHKLKNIRSLLKYFVMKINKMQLFYLLFVFVCVKSEHSGIPANYSNPCSEHNHILLTPGVLTAGASNRVCISRFHTEGGAKFNLMLLTEDKKITTASREFGSGDGGCIDLLVPSLPNTKADMIVTLRYPSHQCTWERHATVRIGSGRVVAVHTERARYRPGDLVRARLLQLRADLTPVHGSIDEVWIEAPHSWEGSRVAQWRRVRTRLGVAQIQHQLEEQAPEGKWTIRVRMNDGTRGVAAFEVGHYELPPFQLTVKHSEKVLRTSERLVWIVCVRYPWTEAVEGMLVIRIRGVGAPNDSSPGIRTAVRLKAPKACHRHAAAAKRIGLDGANSPDVVVADFSFQEEGTRIWQNTTVVSQVVDKPVSLEFLTKHRAIIAPGLPYKLKVKATTWDSRPSPNERIKICGSPTNEKGKKNRLGREVCDEETTDAGGIARVTLKVEGDASFYKYQAFLKNDSTTSTSPLLLPINQKGSLHAALGPLKVETLNVRTLVPLYLSAKSISTAITAHFVVITRGGIIYRWGATTQCPITNIADRIQTTMRDSPCYSTTNFEPGNLLAEKNTFHSDTKIVQRRIEREAFGIPAKGPKKSDERNSTTNLEPGNLSAENTFYNDTKLLKRRVEKEVFGRPDKGPKKSEERTSNPATNLLDYDSEHHLLRIMLPLKITHQMCPDSHLIVYFYHNGEFVSASKHFEMDDCFVNEVEATWQSKQVAPSSPATLRLSTPGPALCALTALDSAAKWVQPASVKETMMSGLKKMMEMHENLTEYDTIGDCFLTEDTPAIPTTALDLTTTWLAAAGIRLLGADAMRNKNCDPPENLMTEDVSVPRSDFSEAWLWRLVQVGANGTVDVAAKAPDSITRYEASAVCLSRTGIAVSQPAVLQVFREFFIHADGSKRLRRGDMTIIRYRLFNYLYEPLSVQIQILTDPHLEGPSDNVDMACIAARSSIARRIELKARLVGKGRVSVRAKSVKDGNCVNATMSSSNVSDEVIIELNVEPEGIRIHEQKSIMLCAAGSPDSNTHQVSWTWPAVEAVPDTETLTIWTSGDITGPLLADADDLILLPRGCGEQNMARMATNLLAFMQLDSKSAAYVTAKEHIIRGYTRQLQYAHPRGGFSAFGSSDPTPSTWLTAFAVRYLKEAHQILHPDQPLLPVIQRAEQWLFGQQMENGCFRNEGQVFHRELKGGLNEDGEIASVALTAYVITSLLDTSPIPARIIKNTLSCLRAMPPMKRKNPARVYALSLLTYAFMKLRNYEKELEKVNEASVLSHRVNHKQAAYLERDENMKQLLDLLKLAKRSHGYVWWETGSLSTSIEATSYALLALSLCPPSLRNTTCANDARGAIQWLSTHRNPTGGFVSTQDTLIALEALTAWYEEQPAIPTNLTATIQGSSVLKTVYLKSGMRVPELIRMGEERKVNLMVEGSGCAIFQATRAYNSYKPEERGKELTVQVSVNTDGPVDCDGNRTNCFCAAVVEACVLWTRSFPEMALLEISLPGGYEADPSLLYGQLQTNDSLLRRIELTPSSSRATLYLAPKDGSSTLGRSGHQCYRIHSIGPRTKTKPAYAKVLDYYKPAVNDTQMYTIPEECPAKLSHKTDDFLNSDNLFVKAKSLNDDNEVLISTDLSFEDIPDGIPLEEPSYDNLTENERQNQSRKDQSKEIERSGVKTIINDEKYKALAKVTKIHDKIELMDEMIDASAISGIPFEVSTLPPINSNKNIASCDQTNETNYIANKNSELGKNIRASNETDKTDYIGNKESIINRKEILPSKNDSIFTDKHINRIGKQLSDLTGNESEIKHTALNKTSTVNAENNSALIFVPHVQRDSAQKDAIKEEIKTGVVKTNLDNPKLSDFHVIDSEKDLAVPSGVEGPVPIVVLPPPNMMTNARQFSVPIVPPVPTVPAQFHPYPDHYQHQDPRMYQPFLDYSQDYWRNYWRYYGHNQQQQPPTNTKPAPVFTGS